jgi:hypothetical protein
MGSGDATAHLDAAASTVSPTAAKTNLSAAAAFPKAPMLAPSPSKIIMGLL